MYRKPSAAPTAYAAMASPSSTRCGSDSSTSAVHESAGIAFIAVADDVFDGIGLALRSAHLRRGGKARATTPAQPGVGNCRDDLFRGARLAAVGQGAIAVARQIIVDMERVDLAAVFEYDARLLTGVRARFAGWISVAPEKRKGARYSRRHTRHEPRRWKRREAPRFARVPEKPARVQMLAHDQSGRFGGHVAIQGDAAAWLDHFHQRLAIAHAVAAYGLDRAGCAQFAGCLLRGVTDRFGAAGNAAGTQADTDFDGRFMTRPGSASQAVAGVSLPAVMAVDHQDRRQAAAA